MIRVLAIAAGGAAGAVLRYWMANGTHALLGRGFPYGTLLVSEFFDSPKKVASIMEHLDAIVEPGHMVSWPAEVNESA